MEKDEMNWASEKGVGERRRRKAPPFAKGAKNGAPKGVGKKRRKKAPPATVGKPFTNPVNGGTGRVF
jgi:hypothetical protein